MTTMGTILENDFKKIMSSWSSPSAVAERQNGGSKNEKNCKLKIPKYNTYTNLMKTLVASLLIVTGPLVLTGKEAEKNCAYNKYAFNGPSRTFKSKRRNVDNMAVSGTTLTSNSIHNNHPILLKLSVEHSTHADKKRLTPGPNSSRHSPHKMPCLVGPHTTSFNSSFETMLGSTVPSRESPQSPFGHFPPYRINP